LNERRDRISQDDSTKFLLALEQFSLDVDFPHNGTQIMNLSRKFKLSVYDAAYLALAHRERLPLATLDKALVSAAQAAGISLLA
jgi:predicted nucleic acid-binding protein